MHFEWIQKALSRHNELLGLFFDGERTHQSGNFLGSLPLRQLSKTFLSCPNTGVNDLQEQLSGPRVENEDGAVDWLGGQIAFKCLVDGDAIDVCIIDEQLDLIVEEFGIILRVQKFLVALRRVELETLPDAFPENIQCWVCFHDLRHGLLNELFQTGEILTVC